MLTRQLLDSFVGKSMDEICPHGFDATNKNHCAHFVGHALQLSFGLTCASLRGIRRAQSAANVRVQEIFDQCPNTEEVIACPTTGQGLIFVSRHTSFHGRPIRIRNVPKKHIGIMYNGIVWHYSNSRDKVITQTVGEFLFHYPSQTNSLWYGNFPVSARATFFGTCGEAV